MYLGCDRSASLALKTMDLRIIANNVLREFVKTHVIHDPRRVVHGLGAALRAPFTGAKQRIFSAHAGN